jgi:uncharacterized protein DUF669
MGFSYEIMSEQDAMNERFQLLKEGIYDAVITASQDTTSTNSGNHMMDMTVTVYDKNGKTHDVRDFLVFTKAMMWKVVHFADSAGMLKEYEEGKLCSETAINKRVMVKIVVEQGSEIPQDKLKGKPLGTRYFDKNKIEDYIKKGEKGAKGVPNGDTPPPFTDDDIPFL